MLPCTALAAEACRRQAAAKLEASAASFQSEAAARRRLANHIKAVQTPFGRLPNGTFGAAPAAKAKRPKPIELRASQVANPQPRINPLQALLSGACVPLSGVFRSIAQLALGAGLHADG